MKPTPSPAPEFSALVREATAKEHAAEVAALRLELDHTRQTLEQLKAARSARVPKAAGQRTRTKGDTVRVIVPDTHGCKADKRAIAAFLADLKTLDPHEIIFLGDHVDCGGFLAQHHVMGYVAETDYSYEDDLAAANALLDAVQKTAPRATIDYIEGNHERRVETWCVTQTLRSAKDSERLRQLYAPEFRLDLAARGIAYHRQGVFAEGLSVPGVIKRGKCFFFHGISTARNAVGATLDRIGGNSVSGHTHRAQSEITRTVGAGVVGAWNPGCLCEMQPLWQHTVPTKWTHGYAVQLVAPSGEFLHLNIPIIDGKTHFTALFKL